MTDFLDRSIINKIVLNEVKKKDYDGELTEFLLVLFNRNQNDNIFEILFEHHLKFTEKLFNILNKCENKEIYKYVKKEFFDMFYKNIYKNFENSEYSFSIKENHFYIEIRLDDFLITTCNKGVYYYCKIVPNKINYDYISILLSKNYDNYIIKLINNEHSFIIRIECAYIGTLKKEFVLYSEEFHLMNENQKKYLELNEKIKELEKNIKFLEEQNKYRYEEFLEYMSKIEIDCMPYNFILVVLGKENYMIKGVSEYDVLLKYFTEYLPYIEQNPENIFNLILSIELKKESLMENIIQYLLSYIKKNNIVIDKIIE